MKFIISASLAVLLATAYFTLGQADNDSNQRPVDSVPHSPTDTSSADDLLPEHLTEAEKEAAARRQALMDTSTADNVFPTAGSDISIDLTQPATATPAPAAQPAQEPAAVTPLTGPETAYAPDQQGVQVKEVTVDEPVLHEVIDPDAKVEVTRTEEAIPALELDFPDSGVVTMAFPTDPAVTSLAEMTSADTISVDFPDEEVRTIIRNVADLYDLNVVIPDTLVGSTSVKLRNVTWRQVMEVVLEPLGFTYVEDRNIIKIRSRDELLQEPVDTRVFLINYAVAANLRESLSPLVDAASGGRIQVDQRTNALIITERPSRMNSIQEIIERLDRPNAQVMIESKFIEVNDRDQRNLGVNWASLSGYRISAGPFQRDYLREASARSDSITDPDSNFRSGSTSSSTNVVNGATTNAFNNTLATTFNNALDASTTAATGRIDTAVFSADAFNMVLSALETLSDSKLLTNPTLVTLDGEDAKILIGDKYPVPNYTYNQEQGTFEVSGFNYEDIGIVLTVRPQVNSAGFIRLDVNPQLSRRNGEVSFGGAGGATIPIINSTETQSSVILKDGYTLAIGGLVQSERIETDTQVPWLGNIPVFGYLFKSKSTNTDERNLIIFITARTLNPDGSTYRDIIDPRMLYRMGITEQDIPGLRIPDAQAQAMEDIFRLRSQAEHDMYELEMQNKLLNLDAVNAMQKSADQAEGAATPQRRNATSRAR